MFKTTKDECRKQLAAEKFKIVERNGRADYWRSYNSIVTENGIETNIVQCNFCGRLDEYDTEKGTRSLGVHATKCNGTNQSKLLTSYFEKNVQITKEEKKAVCDAATEFCFRDIRPFYAIEGDGLLALVMAVNKVSAKHGVMSKQQCEKMLPCANTVSLFQNFKYDVYAFIFRNFRHKVCICFSRFEIIFVKSTKKSGRP